MFDVSLATQMVHQTKSNWKKKQQKILHPQRILKGKQNLRCEDTY